MLVGVGASPHFVLIFSIAWNRFESAQELLDPFDIGFGAAWFKFWFIIFLAVNLVHRAQ